MPVKSLQSIPEGLHTLTPVLNFKGDCNKAIEFYKKAFDAVIEGDIFKGPNDMVMHAMLVFGNSNFMLSDLMVKDEETFGLRSNMWVYVDDCDTVFQKAVAAGCKVRYPVMDMFWGDRVGAVIDPFSHQWSIATLQWILTPEEMRKGEVDWMNARKDRK